MPAYNTARQYQVGDFSREDCSAHDSIMHIDSVVERDLEVLGYNVNISTTMPSSIMADDSLICVRKGGVDWYEDYHFMRYENGSWYHKTYNHTILKYKYQPGDKAWIREYVNSADAVAGINPCEYDSMIYYITYSPHFYTGAAVPYDQYSHKRLCSVSGCNSYILESHRFDTMIGNRRVCSDCGFIQNGTIPGFNAPLLSSFGAIL